MWRTTKLVHYDDGIFITLVDVEDEEHWIEVDLIRYQVLEDMGLINDKI